MKQFSRLTDLGKLICNFHNVNHTPCRNFRIFVSVRLYVKSFLEILEVLKLPFLAILLALNFVILELSAFKKCKHSKNQNSQPLNVFKWQILHVYNPQNQFYVNSGLQKNHVISSLCVSHSENCMNISHPMSACSNQIRSNYQINFVHMHS